MAPPDAAIATLVRHYRDVLVAGDARTIADQVALAEIPAPTQGEQARARWVAGSFRAMGLEVTHDAAGNVLATIGNAASAPPVVVCAHLDTVFPASVPHDVQRDGPRLTGPGIGDNARGIAGMLAIARAYLARAVPVRHPVILAATVGEEGEGDLRGARHLFATAAANAHAAFALDGAGDERIVAHALGTRRFRVAFRGAGGHSWAASDTPNPLHAAAQLAVELARLPMRAAPRTTVAVTRIEGGSAVNAIPANATIDVEFRSAQGHVLESGERELRRLVAAAIGQENATAGAARQALTARIDVTSDRPTGTAPADSDPVTAALGATRAIGRTPEFAIGSTDANVPLGLGIPAVSLGAGGCGGDTHTPGEWFENRDGALGLLRAMAAILATAGAG